MVVGIGFLSSFVFGNVEVSASSLTEVNYSICAHSFYVCAILDCIFVFETSMII